MSERHAPLARKVEALTAAAVEDAPALGVWPGLVDLVWVAQAAELDSERETHGRILTGVRQAPELNQALFWRGVERMVEVDPDLDPVRLWRWQGLNRHYWTIGAADRPWLERAAKGADLRRRRIAFAVLLDLAGLDKEAADPFGALRGSFANDPQLVADLDAYLAPNPMTRQLIEHEKRREANRAAQAEAEALNQQGLRELRDLVVAEPVALADVNLLQSWTYRQRLVRLTVWLSQATQGDRVAGALLYRDLAPAFSEKVAEDYRAGMVGYWRTATPRGLTYQKDGRFNRPWSSVLSMAGLRLDAETTPNWTGTLDGVLAARAVQHAFKSQMDFPKRLDTLLEGFPATVEPYVIAELKREWALQQPAPGPLLYRAGADLPLTPGVQRTLLRLIEHGLPGGAGHLEHARKILRRLELTPGKRRSLHRKMSLRLKATREAGDFEAAMAVIPVLFVLEPHATADDLRDLLAAQPPAERQERAERALGALFGMSRGQVWGLRSFPAEALADLLRLAYHYVRPEDDHCHEGSYSPDGRDDAETARNELLGALTSKTGEGAFMLMRQLLAENAFGVSTPWLHRLAVDMAEAASEGAPWSAAAVRRFEAEQIEPVTAGERLFALVCELIAEIDAELRGEDVSARELLLTAKTEHAVQSWLASMLKVRSKGRFSVPIEAEAPGRDRLDITVIANGGEAEVAVEMKHGEKGWTVPKYEASLVGQLAGRYLKPTRRRHGVFVVSNHRRRFWKDETGRQIGFAKLIGRLQARAETLTSNAMGPIHVAVRGIDAVLPTDTAETMKGRGVKTGSHKPAASKRKPMA